MTGELSLACTMTCSWQVTSSGWTVHCMSARQPTWPTQSFILLRSKKWVGSWTQAFALRTCVVVPPDECLRIKADTVYCLQVTQCDPQLSVLEEFAKTRYTNRRYYYILGNRVLCATYTGILLVCIATWLRNQITVKTAWSYLQLFCHNTLELQTTDRQATSYDYSVTV